MYIHAERSIDYFIFRSLFMIFSVEGVESIKLNIHVSYIDSTLGIDRAKLAPCFGTVKMGEESPATRPRVTSQIRAGPRHAGRTAGLCGWGFYGAKTRPGFLRPLV